MRKVWAVAICSRHCLEDTSIMFAAETKEVAEKIREKLIERAEKKGWMTNYTVIPLSVYESVEDWEKNSPIRRMME